MESIPKNECQQIGYLQKPHGIKGEIVLQMEEDYFESLENYPTLYLEIDGLLVPFFISAEGIRYRSSEAALIQFDWIENEDHARKLCGCPVYLKFIDLVTNEDEVSLHQLIGFELFDSKIGIIGKIEHVDDYAGNLIFQVTYQQKEILIPFNQDFLIHIDEAKKEIELQLPEGIFDLD